VIWVRCEARKKGISLRVSTSGRDGRDGCVVLVDVIGGFYFVDAGSQGTNE